MQDIIKKGSTDRSVRLRFVDSTDGFTPETGVTDATTGLALWYRREGGAKVAITPAALAALTTAHTDGGVEHISDGEVRIDVPDAAFATGANYVDIGGSATGMIVQAVRVRLVDFDPEDASYLGLSALTNASIAFAGPVWTTTGLNQPITAGDNLLNTPIEVTLVGYDGRDLSTADTIVMEGKLAAETFSWSGTHSTVGGNDVISFTPDSTDTNQTAGTWSVQIKATWSTPAEVLNVVAHQTAEGRPVTITIIEDLGA